MASFDYSYIRPSRRRVFVSNRFILTNGSDSEEAFESSFQFSHDLPFENKLCITKRDLLAKTTESKVNYQVTNALILDYFITNGMLEEAQEFAKEASIDITQSYQIDFAIKKSVIKQAFSDCIWSKVVNEIEALSPAIFKNNPSLLLKILLLKLTHLNSENEKEFRHIAQTEILPMISKQTSPAYKKALLQHFEQHVGAIVLNKEIYIDKQLLWNEIECTIDEQAKTDHRCAIERLIQLGCHVQSTLGKHTDVPRIEFENMFHLSGYLDVKSRLEK